MSLLFHLLSSLIMDYALFFRCARSSLSREASNRQVIGIDYVGLQQL